MSNKETTPVSEQQSDLADMPDLGEHVDRDTFDQILEMDEDVNEREFSKPLILGFFDQAEDTFAQMDEAVTNKDLKKLSELGHFLKGSSATLGFNKVRDSCQVIQQYGNHLTLDSTPELDDAVCFQHISTALAKVKTDMDELKQLLRKFFAIEP